ncbi:MAG: amino acid permease, partial [Acidobacteriota bacterium]
YPRAMLGAAALVACVYMIPVATMWALGIPAGRFSTGAWADAATLVAGGWLAFTVVAAGSLDGLGTFNALTLTLTRLPYAMAEDGLLPSILRRRTAKGVPWVSVIVCAICWALALTLPFERLISIDLVLYGGALLLEFVALAVLRRSEPDLYRPFRVPGPRINTILIAIGPCGLLGFAIYAARDEKVAGLNALLFAALVAIAGALIYAAFELLRPKSAGIEPSHRQ